MDGERAVCLVQKAGNGSQGEWKPVPINMYS